MHQAKRSVLDKETGDRTTGYAVIPRVDKSSGKTQDFWVYYWGKKKDECIQLAPAVPGSFPPPLTTWI